LETDNEFIENKDEVKEQLMMNVE